MSRHVDEHSFLFALALFLALLVANIVALPAFADPSSYAATLGQLAPFALVAVASTPSILSGNGGIDVSIGPLMGLLGIVYVVELLPHGLGRPEVAIPLTLALGAAVGSVNGIAVSLLRYPPVIATLCAYFVLAGIGQKLAPTPRFAEPNWTDRLGESYGPVPGGLLTIAAPLAAWMLLRRTAFVTQLRAVGGNDVAAFTAGVRVTAIRVAAYALGGAFAGVAALALTGLVRDGDATIGPQYTLVALVAVALGGTPLTGGRGGLLGSVLGAACIFLVQNLLAALHVSPLWLQVVYGAILVAAVVLGTRLTRAEAALT
jgi:ribose transport system permease protein